MNTIRLSKRLLCAAGAVRENARVADVGCDHGKLCAYLVASGRVPFAVATDISAPSLEKARALFAACGITDRARTVLCDGLSGVEPSEADDVVIAGVGADTAAAIIGACGWLRGAEKRLILVPASHHEKLRVWLYENGFALRSETAVFEDGRCYTVMTAAYTGEVKTIEPAFAALGLLRRDTEDARRYFARERDKARRIAAAPCGEEKRAAALAVLRRVEDTR